VQAYLKVMLYNGNEFACFYFFCDLRVSVLILTIAGKKIYMTIVEKNSYHDSIAHI